MTEEIKTPVVRGNRKERTGTVVRDSKNKTVVVEVSRRTPHPLYKKVVQQSKRFHAHDEENRAKAGDFVRIVETRPLSKLKRWRLLEIIRHSNAVAAEIAADVK